MVTIVTLERLETVKSGLAKIKTNQRRQSESEYELIYQNGEQTRPFAYPTLEQKLDLRKDFAAFSLR